MKQKNIDLSKLSEEELLNLRICDLPLGIEGTWLSSCINQLYHELNLAGIKFRPVCYLADEWLAPDKEPVVGVPFFLAHPALIKLERKMMLDVEGGTRLWCMKLLRHETGHAVNYAYKLYRRKKWQKIFGQFSKEYGDTYKFRLYSKSFVHHLDDYYAQHHPDEDFSETFAVWLTPSMNWQEQYKGWKVIKKLNYVDSLMKDIKDKEPLLQKGKKYWKASGIKITLKNFYKKKQHFHAEDFPDFHDLNLKSMFIAISDKKSKNAALITELIMRHKRDILNNVARWTGERKYIVAGLLGTIVQRSKALKLTIDTSEPLAMLKISTYITTLVMNYLYTGGFRKKR